MHPNKAHALDGGKPRRLQLEHHWPATSDAQRWAIMRRSICLTLLAVAALATAGCCHTSTAAASKSKPVITVEERPAMYAVLSKRSGRPIIPGIDIFEDGRCVVRTFNGDESEKVLQKSDVQTLLDFFDQQDLFSISEESITGAVARQGQFVVFVDGTTTRLAAREGARQFDVSRKCLNRELESYSPNVRELRAMVNCIEKVYEVAGRIH
jgi:hypothetical protein